MDEQNLLELTNVFCSKVWRLDEEISEASRMLAVQQENVQKEYTRKRSQCTSRIDTLTQYKRDYASYIASVHERYTIHYNRNRTSHLNFIKKSYDELVNARDSARNRLNNSPKQSYYSFRFFHELINAIVSPAEDRPPFKRTINLLIAFSYVIASLLIGYTLWAIGRSIFGPEDMGQGPLNFIRNDLFVTAITGFFIFNVIVLGFRVYNRYLFSKDSKYAANAETDKTRKEREKELEFAERNISNYMSERSRYFRDGRWSPPVMDDILFNESSCKDILNDALRDINSPVDTSIYPYKYTFKID